MRLSHRKRRDGSGFTLLEVLIATVATMLMMLSLAVIFRSIGEGMKAGRAALELNNKLRNVTYRIRTALDNMTVNPAKSVSDASPQNGYLKYVDGSLNDYAASLIPSTPTNLSRFGDVDDILMFTAKADDEWFTGKVPVFVLRQAAEVGPTAIDPVTDRNGDTIPDDLELVTIASQYAEIVIYCEPEVTNNGNPARDTSLLIQDPSNYADTNGDGFPDGFRLHYRTLLIRPDLNIDSGGIRRLPTIQPGGSSPPWMYASIVPQIGQLPDGTSYTLPRMCDMAKAHAQCDLSIRRTNNPFAGKTGDFVSANSLEDLVNPFNRFAHYQSPIPGVPGALTMPLLAMTRALQLNYGSSVAAPWDPSATADPDGYLGGSGTTPAQVLAGSGFLHPAFTLNTGWGDAITSARVGEDVLTTNILAFDVKAYDPMAGIIGSRGPDAAFGILGVDDDGSGTPDDPFELGAAGSDDLMLSPSDPGYARALVDYSAGNATVAATGEYVDLGWARKTIKTLTNHLGISPGGFSVLARNALASQLSGYSPTATVSGSPFTNALYKSGLVVQSGTNVPLILQMAYDSYTAAYESDGILQAELSTARGVVWTPPPGTLLEPWRATARDGFTDGLDNPGSGPGADDVTEKETSAPFPVELRGLRVSVRIEDPASRQFNQMTVTKEFVNQ